MRFVRLKLGLTSYISPTSNAPRHIPVLRQLITCEYMKSRSRMIYFIRHDRKIARFDVSTDGNITQTSDRDISLHGRVLDGTDGGLSIQNGYAILFRCGTSDTFFELFHIDTGNTITCPLTVRFGIAIHHRINPSDHRAHTEITVNFWAISGSM